jgi:hypothetical protein
LPFKETAADYCWRHVKEPRDIFGSWVVVVVDLKSFNSDASDILGAIRAKKISSPMIVWVAAMMGSRFGTMEARTAGAKCGHIASTWPGTMTMTYRRAALISTPGKLGDVK